MASVETFPTLAGATQYDFLITGVDEETDRFNAVVVRCIGEDIFRLGNKLVMPFDRVKDGELDLVYPGQAGSYLVAQADYKGRTTQEAIFFEPCDLAKFAIGTVRHAFNMPDFEELVAERRSGIHIPRNDFFPEH